MPQENQIKMMDVSKAVDSAVNILKLIENLSPTSADLLLRFSEAGSAEVGNAKISGRLFGTTNLKIAGTEKSINLAPEHLFSEDIRQAFTDLAKDANQRKTQAFLQAIYQSIELNPHWQNYWKQLDVEPAKKQKIHDYALGSLAYMIVGAVQQPATDALVNEGIATARAKSTKEKEDVKFKVLRTFQKAIVNIMTAAKALSTVNSNSVTDKFAFDHANYNKFIGSQPAPSLRKSSLFRKPEKRNDIPAAKSVPPSPK